MALNTLAPFQTTADLLGFLRQLDVSVMKLGLERIRKVLTALEDPQDQVKTIHIVGTNGKGSVAATLAAIYTAAGYQTGLFISPHLVDIRERIQRQAKPISEAQFLEAGQTVYAAMIQALPSSSDWLTYFEFINAMAFWLFARDNVDIAIIEAGLGGRLDSTNVLRQPQAVAVTPISLDHADRLGGTLPAIAHEKAGVFKSGVPVVSASQSPEVQTVLVTCAEAMDAPLMTAISNRFDMYDLITHESQPYRRLLDRESQSNCLYPLLGRYQQQNLDTVMSIVDLLEPVLPVPLAAWQLGLQQVQWPGRFQYLPNQRLVIDGSHNPAGFQTLLETLCLDFPQSPIHWGITLLQNRDVYGLEPLLRYKHTASVQFLKGMSPQPFHDTSAFKEVSRLLPPQCPVGFHESPLTFCQTLPPQGELKILTGSLYTVGHVLSHLARV